MSNSTSVTRPMFKVVAIQFVIVTGFALLAWNWAGPLNAWSAAYGGAIAVIGSLMYAIIVTRGTKDVTNDAKQVFRSHVKAELVKIFFTLVLFIVALALFQSASWLWLILGFAVATLAYWFSLLAV